MKTHPPLLLQGVIQNYDWGGTHFLPEILSLPNPEERPHAEYWLGTHHRGEAFLPETKQSLGEWLTQHQAAHDKLPFLLKILDVNAMLSIQAHPSRKAAQIGFAEEERKGIPINAANRIYRDQNHKPELMVALTPFWLLHGFRTKKDILTDLTRLPFPEEVLQQFQQLVLAEFYSWWMRLPQEHIDEALIPLRQHLLQQNDLQKSSPDFWANKAFQDPRFAGKALDRGILSIYLLHLLQLQVGEAIYQPAGYLHAYLEGANVEIMATSDNVFRGGLTNKHIDVPSLLNHVDFSPIVPDIIKAEPDVNPQIFDIPLPDFSLMRWQLNKGDHFSLSGENYVRIGLVLRGSIRIEAQNFSSGQSFLIPANQVYEVEVMNAGQLFIAGGQTTH